MIETGAPKGGTGAMVLVADDDDDLRALVVDALLADGYRARSTCDGVELLALVAETLDDPATRPALLVLDAHMPKLSGFGVLKELRRTHIQLPALIMSAFHPDSVATLAMRFGAVSVLRKPFDVGELRAALGRAIPQRS